MSKILIVTEDNPELTSIRGIAAKIIFYFYINLYKLLLKKTIKQWSTNSQISVLTNKIFRLDHCSKNNFKFYDELWGEVNWDKVRNESWNKARNWFKNISDFNKVFTIKNINLYKVSETRVALHLARSVISYKDIIRSQVEKFNPDIIITMTLNSPPENFAALIAKQKGIKYYKVNRINIFSIYPLIRRYLWHLEENRQLENLQKISSGPKQPDVDNGILIVVSHELHLKAIKPLLMKFEERKIKTKLIYDFQNINTIANNYDIKLDSFDCFLKHLLPDEVRDTFLTYKDKFLLLVKKSADKNEEYLDQYLTNNFREKLSQYIGFSAVYAKAVNSFLTKNKPRAIVFISDRSLIEASFALDAKKLNIPTYLVSPNNLLAVDKMNEYKITDYVLVTGQYIKEELIKIGVDRNKIYIVGDLRFDDFIMKKFNKEKILKKYDIDSNKKIILLISTYVSTVVPYDEKKSAFQLVNQALKNLSGFQLLIKCHPNEKIEVLKSQIKEWGIEGKVVAGNLQELLYVSEAICQTTSMSGFEAIVFSKPIFVINPKEIYENFIPYIKNRAAISINSKEEIIQNLKRIEKDKVFLDTLIKNGNRFLQNYIYKIDGKTSERVVNFVMEKLS